MEILGVHVLGSFFFLLGKDAREDGVENFNTDFWEHVRRHNAGSRGSDATKMGSKDLRVARQLKKSLNLESQAIWKILNWKSGFLSYFSFLSLVHDSVVKNLMFC